MHVFQKQTRLISKANAQSTVPLKNISAHFLPCTRLYTILNSTQQRYAHQINVTHSSCQTRTMRKKFPIKASVESMSHVLDLRLDCDYTPTSTDLHLQWASDGCPTQRKRSSPSSSMPKLMAIARLDDSTTASESNIRLWRQQKERLPITLTTYFYSKVMTLKLPCVLYMCTLILPMTRRPQSTCALYTSAHFNRDNTVHF